MRPFKCPDCQTEMQHTQHPDITTDTCPDCGGVLLEKDELNSMATGMAGDIEFCSIGWSDFSGDTFPSRVCPKCADQQMKKVNLLAFSDLIFDYCEQCESFFLDKGEIPRMNEELKKLTPHGVEQEYRDYREDHLVRIDRRNGAAIAGMGLAGMATRAVGVASIRITVYFTKPLETDLRVFQETWYAKLAKAFCLLPGQDIPTGDSMFDKLFRVQGTNEAAIVSTLNSDFKQAAVQFALDKPKIISQPGSLELSRNLISYTEGPYQDQGLPPIVKQAEPLVKKLIALARLLER
jgi:Zn-finger nucleic acid-binding protein